MTNWDLNDIERVEIIRGPGSVTYGPGAIAGVINIITKTAPDVPRPELTVKYTHEYDSKMAAISYGVTKPNWEFFGHLSIAAVPDWMRRAPTRCKVHWRAVWVCRLAEFPERLGQPQSAAGVFQGFQRRTAVQGAFRFQVL